MRKAMNATSVKVRTFFWGVWGMSELNASSSFYLAPDPDGLPLPPAPSRPLHDVRAQDLRPPLWRPHLLKILSVQTVVCLAYLVLCGKIWRRG